MNTPGPRAVLLLHTRPGHPDHTDLLLERPPASPDLAKDPDDRRLIAFRLGAPSPDPAALDLPATRTPDHRAHYLTHEGPVSGGRGCVHRRLCVPILDLRETPDEVRATLLLNDSRITLTATRLYGDTWRIRSSAG